MKQIQKDGLIISLINSLKEHGSWCGETHVQKATYFLQEMMEIPLGFDFIIYKHGPFSFDLSDELKDLRADFLLKWEDRPAPYGNSLTSTDYGQETIEKVPLAVTVYQPAISFIAEEFGSKGVKELEKIATALFVIVNGNGMDIDSQAFCITQMKPHISLQEAKRAITEVERMMEKAKEQSLIRET